MRKQTKIAAVVSAAALLALGASITSFAAAKGTWMMVDGEWYCYDKNGDVYENTFCSSNGKEYYVGDDGMLVRSSWVEYDGDYYFVNSSGAKITNDWRLTTPYEDEDADEEWFYFQSTGKRADNKKILYKGSTFFFDADGKMLTGWVTADGDQVVNEENSINTSTTSTTYYCDETGARVESGWVYTTAPSTPDDDADADEYWYYLKSSGKVATGKQSNVKGQAFILGNQSDNLGQMLTGWVGGDLNAENKPAGIFNQTIHDNCERRGHFENGEFVYEFGSKEEALGYCLYPLGCRGPQTKANCGVTLWNNRRSWCVQAGTPCIGCCEANPNDPGHNWVEVNTPFYKRHRDLRIGDWMVQPGTIALIITGVVAGALVVHGFGMKITGRMDGGADFEKVRGWDAKHPDKSIGKYDAETKNDTDDSEGGQA